MADHLPKGTPAIVAITIDHVVNLLLQLSPLFFSFMQLLVPSFSVRLPPPHLLFPAAFNFLLPPAFLTKPFPVVSQTSLDLKWNPLTSINVAKPACIFPRMRAASCCSGVGETATSMSSFSIWSKMDCKVPVGVRACCSRSPLFEGLVVPGSGKKKVNSPWQFTVKRRSKTNDATFMMPSMTGF